MPGTERADEADRHSILEAILRANTGTINSGTVAIRVDAIRIYEHAILGHAVPDDLVFHRCAHDDDKIGRAQIQKFDALGELFVREPASPVPAYPDFGAVVFHDKRHTA